MNILAIDYGRAHLGLALATTPLAEPLCTIPFADHLSTLAKIIATHHIDHLLVGVSEGVMAAESLAFATQLSQHFSLPVSTHDETLSSQTAHTRLTHKPRSHRRGPDHHFAAALFLQDYLDTQL